MELNEDQHQWKIKYTKMLITTRLKHEKEFMEGNKKKNVLWGAVLSEILKKDPEFPFTKYEIIKKFMNIIVTYKRIKKRQNMNGKCSTTWEFFDEIDEIYGARHTIELKRIKLSSSVSLSDEDEILNFDDVTQELEEENEDIFKESNDTKNRTQSVLEQKQFQFETEIKKSELQLAKDKFQFEKERCIQEQKDFKYLEIKKIELKLKKIESKERIEKMKLEYEYKFKLQQKSNNN